MATKMYGNAILKLYNQEVNWLSDTIKFMLVSSSYVFNQDSHIYKSDISYEISGATGYSAGGLTLSSKTATYYGSNSATSWQASHSYSVGNVVKPASSPNGHVYLCTQAGTSEISEPIFPTTSGGTVVDSGVVWTELGNNVVILGAGNLVFADSTITASAGIVYKSTGLDSTSPLLAYEDFGSPRSSSSGNFSITWNPFGIILHNIF